MRRTERKLFALNDRLAALREERRNVEEELMVHRHLDDDAQRDAAVSGHAADRADAADTAADVVRFERHLRKLEAEEARLEAKRQRLLGRLSGDL
jgi:seryl-tRNA synthetase